MMIGDKERCSTCGADTKDEWRRPCPNPLAGETNPSLLNQETSNNSNNSSSSSSSSSSNSSNDSSSSKNDNSTSGETKITDSDGNTFLAFIPKQAVPASLDRLRFMIRVSIKERWDDFGVGNSKFLLDSIGYLQRLNYFANRLDGLSGVEAATWKTTNLLKSVLSAPVFSNPDKFERLLSGNVVFANPTSLDILDFDALGLDFELPTASTVSDSKRRSSTPLFRRKMESVLSDTERAFNVISGSLEFVNTTQILREKLQGGALALVPDLAVWYLIWEAFCEFFRIVRTQKTSTHVSSMLGPQNVATILTGVINAIQWNWDESKWQFVLSAGAIGGISFGVGKKRPSEEIRHDSVKGGGVGRVDESSGTSSSAEVPSSPPRERRKLADKGQIEVFCGYHLAGYLECKKDGNVVQCHHQQFCKKGAHTDFKKELTKSQVQKVLEENKDMFIGSKTKRGSEGFYLGEKLYNEVIAAVNLAKNKFK